MPQFKPIGSIKRTCESPNLRRNVAHGPPLARNEKGPEDISSFKLATHCRELKDQALDNVSRSQLATLEYSYLMLAKSSQMLRRSVRLQKVLERRHRK